MDKIAPVHPGEILRDEFLAPLKISQNKLAVSISVPPRRINEIVLGKRGITADTALRLSCYFGNTPEFWLGLQSAFELQNAKERLGGRLDRGVILRSRL